TITVHNNCPSVLTIGRSESGQLTGTSIAVKLQRTHTSTLSPHWKSRVCARTSCQGRKCNYAGLGAPASLAEFLFHDDNENLDYYDISFVDG
ncbi:hypothetical protein BDB00DRAFT_768201, partial [Zychaea mexicana]|uniref:uncharacterized protein n=1 Tax=Zychaea mexicana TaxID=64656 RepID=UPI0022FE0489